MCGIFAYIGKKAALPLLIKGLKQLEYRGYDSAGLAFFEGEDIAIVKDCGKVENLEEKLPQTSSPMAIGHTRWATHGKVSIENAHPHISEDKEYVLVHNGIIENDDYLKQEMKGLHFYSQTDSEVLVNALAKKQGSVLEKIAATTQSLQGSFACVVMVKSEPNTLYAFAKDSSLVMGLGEEEQFISSDAHAFYPYTSTALYLKTGEIAKLSYNNVEVFDTSLSKIDKNHETLDIKEKQEGKGSFAHFTLKEIFDQRHTVKRAFFKRFKSLDESIVFEGLKAVDVERLKKVKKILLLACGTSWHAALYASYLFSEKLHIPSEAHISSEFRYRSMPLEKDTLVIAISQSGETADTLAAVKSLKSLSPYILSLCNVVGSSLSRQSDATLYLEAGIEIGVCSTKAFTSQVTLLFLLCLYLNQIQEKQEDLSGYFQALKMLPQQVESVLDQHSEVQKLATSYSHYEHFFYLGRHYMYPCSLEGALKLKEITYINANAYPAGELKHGPIALISKSCPTFAFCTHRATYGKMVSNLKEIKARLGPLIALSYEGDTLLPSIADEVFYLPENLDELMLVTASVFSQLFAYYVALEKGLEVDTPRNLAKSVTVE